MSCPTCNGNKTISQHTTYHSCSGNEMDSDKNIVGRCTFCKKLCGSNDCNRYEDVTCGTCGGTGKAKAGGYYEKYLKYKNKYLELKKQLMGGKNKCLNQYPQHSWAVPKKSSTHGMNWECNRKGCRETCDEKNKKDCNDLP
jgi:hypothetical protein